MRFGISATSWIFPKNFLTRLRPVNVCAAISPLVLSYRRAGTTLQKAAIHRDRQDRRQNPSAFKAIRLVTDRLCHSRQTADIRAIPEACPGNHRFVSRREGTRRSPPTSPPTGPTSVQPWRRPSQGWPSSSRPPPCRRL